MQLQVRPMKSTTRATSQFQPSTIQNISRCLVAQYRKGCVAAIGLKAFTDLGRVPGKGVGAGQMRHSSLRYLMTAWRLWCWAHVLGVTCQHTVQGSRFIPSSGHLKEPKLVEDMRWMAKTKAASRSSRDLLDPLSATVPQTAAAPATPADQAGQQLEVVLATYNPHSMFYAAEFWKNLLAIPKVALLQPSVTIYCQNPALNGTMYVETAFAPVLENGRVIYLDNKGRESRAYLYHIISNWESLARHTWFSQDIPEAEANAKVENLFQPSKTAMLGVGPSWPVDCDDKNWPIDNVGASTSLQELVFALTKGRMCETFFAVYRGQFLVSAGRIRRQKPELYGYLLQLVEAPQDHMIHSRHEVNYYKDPSNPWFGHVLERSWSLLFDCSDMEMEGLCRDCESQGWKNCPAEACQCME